MQTDLTNIKELQNFVTSNLGAAVYFSTQDCNVCKVLKPKVKELLKNSFPEIKFAYADLNNSKELASQLSIFSVPTILFFFDGKELIRKSRNISLYELETELERPYSLMF